MDPSACLALIAQAIGSATQASFDNDRVDFIEEAQAALADWRDWLDKGGFPGELNGVCGLQVVKVFAAILE